MLVPHSPNSRTYVTYKINRADYRMTSVQHLRIACLSPNPSIHRQFRGRSAKSITCSNACLNVGRTGESDPRAASMQRNDGMGREISSSCSVGYGIPHRAYIYIGYRYEGLLERIKLSGTVWRAYRETLPAIEYFKSIPALPVRVDILCRIYREPPGKVTRLHRKPYPRNRVSCEERTRAPL